MYGHFFSFAISTWTILSLARRECGHAALTIEHVIGFTLFLVVCLANENNMHGHNCFGLT